MPVVRALTPASFLTLLALLLLSLAAPCGPAVAQAPRSSPEGALDPALALTTLPLYLGRAPHASGDAPADTPTLTVFRPVHSNGAAVLVAPGGAYLNLAANHEGRQPADHLTELGITVFVLKYRLGPTYLYPVPLDDARRAVRLVRSLARTYGYAPDRIGMMGFSAGGHLAATAGTLPTDGNPADADPVERESSRLNFLVLAYPWLNAMQPPIPNAAAGGKPFITYCSVTRGLGEADCRRLEAQFGPTAHVTANTPPTFIVHTADDTVVPVAASVDFFTAMHRAGADCELHVLAHGPHGFGTGADDPTLAPWQDLLTLWLRAHGLLTPPTH